jgi:hypothetical protein
MTTATRRKLAPLKVTTSGSPLQGDLRALAALLVRLDQRPPLKLVQPPSPDLPEPTAGHTDDPSTPPPARL